MRRVAATDRREVAEPRGRVVLLEVAVDAAGRPERAGQAVEVGDRGDREHFVVVRGNPRAEVLAAIPGGHDVRHSRRDRVAYRTVERVRVGVAAVAVVDARTAEAHIRDLDLQCCGVRGDPVDAADHLRVGAAALRVDDLDRVDLRARRHADDACAVVARGDRPGDVRSVAVVVARRLSVADAVLAADRVEVRVREVDPAVDDRDVHGRSLTRGGCCRGSDAPYAGRSAVAGRDRHGADRVQSPVGRDEQDVAIGAKASEL